MDVLLSGFVKFDWLIFLAMGINAFLFRLLWLKTDTLYFHFNPVSRTSKLNLEAIRKLKEVAKKEDKDLSDEELMAVREKMNQYYAFYYNITAMFPLMGMLGTVLALIPLVNSMGEVNISSFFAALTSTLWGIIFALIFKFLDSFVSYKIEDVEKRMDDIISSRYR